MDTDIHLDTSWCPVCDCAIPPRRYTVPVAPPPALAVSNNAIKASQTMRGKNGTIKARNGLVQGTGRMRGALNRANSTKGKASRQAAQEEQFVVEQQPVRTRTIIDPAPTPLYCSEECRKRDMEESWPVALPPARDVLDAPQRRSRARLGEHPSQINPARASPPPPSPTLPPVPPNSWRAPSAVKAGTLELDVGRIAECIHESDEHSDSSSSATGTSFTASDRSPVEEQSLDDWSNLYSDPPAPMIRPLPLHPHRPSAPVVPPGSNRNNQELRYEGGIMMAAKRIDALLKSDAVLDEQAREEKRERQERQRREEARLMKWDYSGELARSSSAEREKKQAEEQKYASMDPQRWHELVYNYPSSSSSNASPAPVPTGIPSTHRRASDSDPSKRVRAPDAPSRTQSALELYAKYPLFARSSATGAKSKMKVTNKSSASIATTYAPVFGISSSSSTSVKSVSSSVSGSGTAGASALTLPGADPEMYAGKKLGGGPRRRIAKGVEGRLLVPDVLLRPLPPFSSSLPSGTGEAPLSTGMRRSGSEANVSSKKSSRSPSVLGAVRESEAAVEGEWHRPEEGSEDSRSSATRSSDERQTDSQSRSRSRRERARPSSRVEERTWSETNGPLYDVPQVPFTQVRKEEVFLPDPLSTPATGDRDMYIAISDQHKGDKVLTRREIREVGRRRGEWRGRQGWWIEKEWEVKYIPARKKLFNFQGRSGKVY